jgi:23S rRNA (adenine2503-C2)-methyltransferase
MDGISLLDLSSKELDQLIESLGLKAYRSRQISAWLYRRGATAYEHMSDISISDRNTLARVADPGPRLELLEEAKCQDGTRKFLWALPDNLKVESVLIQEKEHRTLCLSTQAGCGLGCLFCRTGQIGFKRNLTSGELVAQILGVRRLLKARDNRVSNLVFMGMGEPLLNAEAVIKSLSIILSPKLMAFSGRHISVSTAGIVPGIQLLGQSGLNVGLTVSLSAVSDKLRSKIMPVNRLYPLSALKKALLAYPLPKGRRITFAYVLLDGVNDSPEQAEDLASFLTPFRSKVNLIPFNPWPGAPYGRPSEKRVEAFRHILAERCLSAFVRDSKGAEAGAACGQLSGTKSGTYPFSSEYPKTDALTSQDNLPVKSL